MVFPSIFKSDLEICKRVLARVGGFPLQDLEDILQDACILFMRSNLCNKNLGFLIKCTKYARLKYLENSRRWGRGITQIDSFVSAPSNAEEELILAEVLDNYLEPLSSMEKEVFNNREIVGDNTEETAKKLGITKSQVSNYLSRAKRKLRENN